MRYGEILDEAQRAVGERRRLRIAYAHFGTVLWVRTDASAREMLAAADIVHPDGIGMHWALRVLHGFRGERINGSDLYPRLIGLAARNNWRCFFLGGGTATAERLTPAAAAYGLPAQSIRCLPGEPGANDAADSIRAFEPDLLLVGMGDPRQHEWVRDHAGALDVPVIVLAGGGLDFLAGTRPRAPRLLRAFGLEWLHRLALEPGRLWRRYLIGIPVFVWLVLREWMKRR